MLRTLLTAKLHHARVTHAELEYEGSCAIDEALLERAGIREYEHLHVYNLENGERFTTYAILARRGSGIVSVNGAAAHKASPGDRLIICTYGVLDEGELAAHRPRLIYLGEGNVVLRSSDAIPAQVA